MSKAKAFQGQLIFNFKDQPNLDPTTPLEQDSPEFPTIMHSVYNTFLGERVEPKTKINPILDKVLKNDTDIKKIMKMINLKTLQKKRQTVNTTGWFSQLEQILFDQYSIKAEKIPEFKSQIIDEIQKKNILPIYQFTEIKPETTEEDLLEFEGFIRGDKMIGKNLVGLAIYKVAEKLFSDAPPLPETPPLPVPDATNPKEFTPMTPPLPQSPSPQLPDKTSTPPQPTSPAEPYGYKPTSPAEPYGYKPTSPAEPYGYKPSSPDEPYGYKPSSPAEPYGYIPQSPAGQGQGAVAEISGWKPDSWNELPPKITLEEINEKYGKIGVYGGELSTILRPIPKIDTMDLPGFVLNEDRSKVVGEFYPVLTLDNRPAILQY